MELLSSVIDSFKNVKVLIVGDIMLDRFIYGKVERISPEAPVPVFKWEREKVMLGGAGNVAANLAALGAKSCFIGIVGKDENGDRVQRLLAKIGVHNHLLKLSDFPTIVKTRLIAGNNHLLRADQEEIIPVVSELLPKFQKIVTQAVKNADIVLLSDYNKGMFTPVTAQLVIEICGQFHKPVLVDPKGADYSKYAGATLVKPNLKEFSEASGRRYQPLSADFHDKAKEGARFLFEKYQIKNLLVTLSEYGMMYIPGENPEDLLQIPTIAKEVFDVSGAGDTVLATLGAALGCGVSIKEAMKLANLASGIVVGKLGTATVQADELKAALSQKETPLDGWKQKKKIITLPQAVEIVKRLKDEHKTVGFTNGCFDCCHLGHLSSFIEAKKLCDVLIVAVNSDQSVKRYKGDSRPVQDEKTRALLLASLEFIDYVIVFDEDSPLFIVEALKPDVVAKEGYDLAHWPEGRLAESYGGKAIILKRIEGYSTSSLVNKMKGL
ncbi:MAG: D-glycero-beta-D-manno-heptose-7-phosphate kinase [Alphaproteobacteria bacterium]|nr:D-glycero-beta-D-manno-heptose-7-phosphate kinase [Alphaproteobacteria bacterium]MBO5284848.1 D-glycero-beta-D-manno-heptose-7-phosphate kinase [Alphaproteobacteria bacterium]